jgi:hypothetical protein
MKMRTEFNCPVLKWSPLFEVEMKKKMKIKNSEMGTV